MKNETIALINPDLEEEQRTNVINEIVGYIGHVANIINTEDWGLRLLVFPIKKHTKAYYYRIEFGAKKKMSPTQAREWLDDITGMYNYLEEKNWVLKYIIVNLEDF